MSEIAPDFVPHETPLVLILCTGNSCRSQMAEAILREAAQGTLRVASAGSNPAGYVHPLAIRVMLELGFDLSRNDSQHVDEFLHENVETVIAVCDGANRDCPAFPGQSHHYCWTFDDPAKVEGSEEEKLAAFRRVRDEINRVFTAYAHGRRDALIGAEPGEVS